MTAATPSQPGLRREAPAGAKHPDRLEVRPVDDGNFVIDVRWEGRDSIVRAVVVRRLLIEAGLEAEPGNAQEGYVWELRVGPVAADEVDDVIDAYIW